MYFHLADSSFAVYLIAPGGVVTLVAHLFVTQGDGIRIGNHYSIDWCMYRKWIIDNSRKEMKWREMKWWKYSLNSGSCNRKLCVRCQLSLSMQPLDLLIAHDWNNTKNNKIDRTQRFPLTHTRARTHAKSPAIASTSIIWIAYARC